MKNPRTVTFTGKIASLPEDFGWEVDEKTFREVCGQKKWQSRLTHMTAGWVTENKRKWIIYAGDIFDPDFDTGEQTVEITIKSRKKRS